MFRPHVFSMLFVGATTLTLIGGCGSQEPAKPQQQEQAVPVAQEEKASSAKEIADAFKDLSAEDRAAAEKQKVCPVSGDALSAMGTPVKITIGSRSAFLCCSSCEDQFRKHPEKYFAKMKKK